MINYDQCTYMFKTDKNRLQFILSSNYEQNNLNLLIDCIKNKNLELSELIIPNLKKINLDKNYNFIENLFYYNFDELLEKFISPNNNSRVFQYSIKTNNYKLARKSLYYRVDDSVLNGSIKDILLKNNEEFIDILLSQVNNVNVINQSAQYSNINLFKKIFEYYSEYNKVNISLTISYALQKDNLPVINYLISKNKNINLYELMISAVNNSAENTFM